ncbi:MAG: PAS domain-containing sensor histidine kinase [Chitinophagaceae bacterium]
MKKAEQDKVMNVTGDSKFKYFNLLKKTALIDDEKYQMQLELNELYSIYNDSPGGYYSVNENDVFIRINDTLLKWLGYTREELIGKKKITDILTPHDVVNFRKNSLIFKSPAKIKNKFHFIRKDKSAMPVIVDSVDVFDTTGNFCSNRSTVFDMTGQKVLDQIILRARKELKNKLLALQKANEEMLQLNDTKDRFIGIAYHDLQSPLAVIMLLSKILLDGDLINSPEKKMETYHTLYEASLQMNELVKNYLNVNRIEKGSINPILTQVDLVKLTKSIILRYDDIAQRKKIAVLFTSGEKNIILMDGECYIQIMENLISNAIKYTHRGKSVFIKIYSRGIKTIVEIEDEGVGIHEHEIPLLYGKFSNISSQPTDGELSTGLGLNIVKFLMDQLKGTISVKSKIGKGTKFTLYFRKDGKGNVDE